jgi:hypothetical protein
MNHLSKKELLKESSTGSIKAQLRLYIVESAFADQTTHALFVFKKRASCIF